MDWDGLLGGIAALPWILVVVALVVAGFWLGAVLF